MKKFIFLILPALLFQHSRAMAHEGHIDAAMHAALHMVEENGMILGLLLLLIIASLFYKKNQIRFKKPSNQPSKKLIKYRFHNDSW
jgi:hypothetical protein|tara:strand:+ start:1040 stop:1297 length:258 start_codon:yes stop_codon:yes gene_type:complete